MNDPAVTYMQQILAMSIEEIQAICDKLKDVTEDIKWSDHLCFNIGGKMFLVTAPDNVPPSASIKVSDDDFQKLTDRDGIIPAPYMAKHKWIFLDDINRFSKKEWEIYIPRAYQLIASKLSAKMQRQLGLTPAASPKKTAKKAPAPKKRK